MCLHSTSCSRPTSLHRTFPLVLAPRAGEQSSWSVLSPAAAAYGPQICPAPCWAEVGETPAALCPGTGGMDRSSTSQDGTARSPRLPHTWKLPEQLFSLGRETVQICNHFAYWGHRPPAEGRFHPYLSDSVSLGFPEQHGPLRSSLLGPPARGC